jgi:hypothetical protein
MLVRTRRMKNSEKDIVIQDGSSSSNDDNELSVPTKSMVDELRTWMDNRLQERLEALNENVQPGPTMVQTDTTTQLLIQILNDQNDRIKK